MIGLTLQCMYIIYMHIMYIIYIIVYYMLHMCYTYIYSNVFFLSRSFILDSMSLPSSGRVSFQFPFHCAFSV